MDHLSYKKKNTLKKEMEEKEMKTALINYIKNELNDELYTPSYAVIPLLKHIPKNKIIWECTDYGASNITKELKKAGYKVISTHISNFNFLKDAPEFTFDIIITNPPYSLKDEFIKKCYEYKKPFALLLPITALEGVNRGKLFREYGIQLIVLDRRVNYMKNKKTNWFNTSWFCYKLLNKDLNFEALRGNEYGNNNQKI